MRKEIDNRSKGFTTIEALIALLVVLLISGIGFVVWQNQSKSSPAPASKAESVPAKKAKSQSSTSTYVIKELGIEFSVPDNLKSMTYKIDNITNSDGTISAAAYLNDPNLLSLAAKCEGVAQTALPNESVNFAAISVIKGTYNAQNADPATDGAFIKQFSDSYITYSVPNGAICGSDDQSINDAWFKGLHDSQEAFSSNFKQTVKKSAQ